jgi:hypothetical protein
MSVGGQRQAPAALPPWKTSGTNFTGLWMGAENVASSGIRSTDRPAHSRSQYRLSYFDLQFVLYNIFIYLRISSCN